MSSVSISLTALWDNHVDKSMEDKHLLVKIEMVMASHSLCCCEVTLRLDLIDSFLYPPCVATPAVSKWKRIIKSTLCVITLPLSPLRNSKQTVLSTANDGHSHYFHKIRSKLVLTVCFIQV